MKLLGKGGFYNPLRQDFSQSLDLVYDDGLSMSGMPNLNLGDYPGTTSELDELRPQPENIRHDPMKRTGKIIASVYRFNRTFLL